MAKDAALNKGNMVIKGELPDGKKISRNRKWRKLHSQQKHEEQLRDMINWANTAGGIDALEEE